MGIRGAEGTAGRRADGFDEEVGVEEDEAIECAGGVELKWGRGRERAGE